MNAPRASFPSEKGPFAEKSRTDETQHLCRVLIAAVAGADSGARGERKPLTRLFVNIAADNIRGRGTYPWCVFLFSPGS